MKEFIADVVIVEKRRIRVSFSGRAKINRDDMLRLLVEGDFDEVLEDETLEFRAVESIEYLELEDVEGHGEESP